MLGRNTSNYLTVCKKWAQVHLKMLYRKCVWAQWSLKKVMLTVFLSDLYVNKIGKDRWITFIRLLYEDNSINIGKSIYLSASDWGKFFEKSKINFFFLFFFFFFFFFFRFFSININSGLFGIGLLQKLF